MTGKLLEREHRRRLGVKKVLAGWPCAVGSRVLQPAQLHPCFAATPPLRGKRGAREVR